MCVVYSTIDKNAEVDQKRFQFVEHQVSRLIMIKTVVFIDYLINVNITSHVRKGLESVWAYRVCSVSVVSVSANLINTFLFSFQDTGNLNPYTAA